MKKIALILAGCGHKDGSEITEAVAALVELSRLGCVVEFFAPDKDFQVKNPITAEKTSEKRNILLEAARITRGKIKSLSSLSPQNYSALAFPGGSGVATNLCNWAEKASDCQVLPEISSIISRFYELKKPIGAICIAPVLLAKTLGAHGPLLTIGDDKETSLEIEKTGARHQVCRVDQVCIDRTNLLVTTPAYMHGGAKSHEVYDGISNWAKALVTLI